MEETVTKVISLGFSPTLRQVDETICHLSKITRLYPELHSDFKEKSEQYKLLGGKINNFIKYVQLNWRT